MAGELQRSISQARRSIDPLDDAQSELSDIIKDDVSVRSITSVNGRFRIRPNPNKKQQIRFECVYISKTGMLLKLCLCGSVCATNLVEMCGVCELVH